MADSAGAKKVSSTALVVLTVVALCAFGLDQFTKYLVVNNLTEGETVPVLGPVLQLLYVRNPGAAFSLASGMTWIFTIIAALVLVFIIWFASRIRSVAWALVFGLLLGGVLGNLTDRLFREPSFGLGHVVDFISTPWLVPAIYNIADSCIVSAMVLFLILTIRGINLDGTRSVKEPKRAKGEEAAASSPDEPEASTISAQAQRRSGSSSVAGSEA